MKVSLNWLKYYTDIDGITPDELCNRMTLSGFEVEGVENAAENMQNVVAGKITALEKHPDADKLQICQIDVGSEVLQIVTGATNVFVGANVPVALDNSVLPNGMNIKTGKLRGVVSQGMLCSGEELCITEEEYEGAGVYGILILKGDIKPGTDMRAVLHKDDCVIDFSITPNRPDCLSMIGMAREIAAVLNRPFRLPEVGSARVTDSVKNAVQVEVRANDLCTRYLATGVKNVHLAPSPKWMQECLLAAGMRPINNIVDITNYVMLETGHPMHAFDARDIENKRIVVRRANDGEKLTTLDEKEYTLTEDMLVIADGERAIGLAGIMGGLNSEIKDDTTDIIFETAAFSHGNIRRTARALGMRTEASARFEKGVDAGTVEYAAMRAIYLVNLLGAGEVLADEIDIDYAKLARRTVVADMKRINGLLGIEVPAADAVDILNRLDIATTEKDGVLTCNVPTYRADIENAADLAEEIIRIYGYEHIESRPLKAQLRIGNIPAQLADTDKVKNVLVRCGCREICTYSFISPKAADALLLPQDDYRRTAVKLLNPLGEEYSVLRTQMYSSMLSALALNANRGNLACRMFECSALHVNPLLPLTQQPKESHALCIGLTGDSEDFFTLKSLVSAVLNAFGVDAEYVPGNEPFMHPYRQADIMLGNKKLCTLGEIHPEVCTSYGMECRALLAQLDLDALFASANSKKIISSLPKFPAVQRDLAVIVDEKTAVGEILSAIRGAGGSLLKNAELFDIYRAAVIGLDKKSTAFSLEFRSDERTLTVEEVNKAFDKIVRTLEYKLGAKLR